VSRAPQGRRLSGRRVAVILAAATVLGAWAGPAADALGGDRIEPVARSSYVVRDGDTLWSIATRLVPGQDPRPVVDAIAAANRVDPAALVPGQTLLIPAGG
jgi:nucleoid-associated protein YgaU